MTDRPAFTDFELRLADELARHAAVARDVRPTAQVAADAMRAGRRRSWAFAWPRRVVLVLAALVLVPLAVALAAGALPEDEDAGAYWAVVGREVDGPTDVVVEMDVVLADGAGRERTLRRLSITDLGLEPGHVIEGPGSLSPQGWLEIHAYREHAPDADGATRSYVALLIDLADPAGAPIILPGNGFTGGRWGPDGRYALYCGYPPDCGRPRELDPHIGSARAARLIDPEEGAGSEIIVPDVELHGGGPEIVWAADGSGFLGHCGEQWGVTPLDGGPCVPSPPGLLSRRLGWARWIYGDGPSALTQRNNLGPPPSQWYRDELAPAVKVRSLFAADGEQVWLLLDDTNGPAPRALLARLSGPDAGIDTLHAIDVPGGAVEGFHLAPDDTFVAVLLGDGTTPRFVLTPLTDDGATVRGRPAIDGRLIDLVPAAMADGWPSR